MGYRVERRDKNWRLIHKLDHGKSGVELRVVSKKSPEFSSLGLANYMTFEQAKSMIEGHRASSEVKRLIDRKAKIAQKLIEKEKIISAWLPPDILQEFETSILPQKAIKPVHWRAAKATISKISTPPWEWCWFPEILSNYLIEIGYSFDYFQRIWTALNVYGAFYCARKNKVWTSLPKINKQVKNRIEAAYEEKKGDKHITFPFSIEMLPIAKKELLETEYNGLRIAFFFGLRVEEMNELTIKDSEPNWFISTSDNRFKFVLNVYQGKLRGRGIAKRWLWKAIPAVEPEQIELLEILEVGNFTLPSLTKLQKYVNSELTRRSFRRGFSPWLTSIGYSKNIISIWLGHIRPETYMQDKHYGDPHYVSYEEPRKK